MVIDFLRSLRTYFQQNCALKVKFLKKIRGVDGRALEGSCKFILGFYDIAYRKIDLSTLIATYQDRQSIQTIRDILFGYGIDSIRLSGSDKFAKVDVPFIAIFRRRNLSFMGFTVVIAIDRANITLFDPLVEKLQIITFNDFISLDIGELLLLNRSVHTGS
jgi:hypothetical protein